MKKNCDAKNTNSRYFPDDMRIIPDYYDNLYPCAERDDGVSINIAPLNLQKVKKVRNSVNIKEKHNKS